MNPFEEMHIHHLRPEVTRLTASLTDALAKTRQFIREGETDSAAIYANQAERAHEALRLARGALARKEDAMLVERASAVLACLKRADVEAMGEDSRRAVLHAREMLRDMCSLISCPARRGWA